MPQSTNSPSLLFDCIVLIISYLRHDVPSLHSLLLVNKTFFRVTVPILYQNPFLLVNNHESLNSRQKTDYHIHLLRLFFSELHPSLRSELPPWIREDDSGEDEDDSYGENGLRITLNSTSKLNQLPQQNRDYASNFEGYFYHYRKHDHSFLADSAIPRLFGTSTWSDKRNILAQLNDVFLKHCRDRVLSICLDSRRVSSYRQFIPILSSLKQLDVHNINMTESALDDVVDWIKLHDSTHGTLRELRMGDVSEYIDRHNWIDMRTLVRLPQAFSKLAVLDIRCWSEAWAMINEIQTDFLERLVMDYGEGDVPESGYEFLSRCPNLKVLDIFVPGPEVFRGILNQFVAQAQVGSGSRNEKQLGSNSSKLIGYKQGETIPPVERLYISGHRLNLKDAMEDTVGFSNSLRVLKATSFTHLSDISEPSIMWGGPFETRFPFLSELQLYGDISLEFPFSLLHCCPNLVTLKLLVNGVTPWNQESNPMDGILSLKKLQFLQLRGNWFITEEFINNVGSKLVTLKILDLEGCYGVRLNQVMKAVHKMKHLRRVGWQVEDNDNAAEDTIRVIEYWIIHAPNISIGSIKRNEFII